MNRLDIDLRDFSTTRADLERLALRQRGAEADVVAARKALAEAVRAGASADRNQLLQERVAAAQAARDGLVAERGALYRRLDELANRFIRERDPAEAVSTLDGHLPIALLPMRIETRYVGAQGQTTLRIRVYPDDLNTIDHEAAPTASEQDSARAYWEARFKHDDDDASRLLRDLIRNLGRGRALWLVRTLTPKNPVPPPGDMADPDFPPVDTISGLAKRTRAVLLPERWCAIGYAGEERVEVFRVWAKNTIPEELVLSPDWLATDDPEALLGGDRAWMVDFDAALEKGMAIEVTQADIKSPANVRFVAPFDLSTDTLERLVVVGFDWTKTAAESGADFTDLLAAHRDSSGLGFAALGTPTNNTEAAPAGYSPSDQRVPPPPSGKSPEDQDALQLMQWAFGIVPEALPPDNIDNPHLCDQRTALHMMNVLWRGTFGDYLAEWWNPVIDGYNGALGPGELFALRQYATSYVRPTGPLPVLRVSNQPYGMLPLVGKQFVDPRDSKVETAVGKVLAVLRPMWELARKKVPLLADGDVDKAKDILQTGPWSQTAYYRDKTDNACYKPNPFADAQSSGRSSVVQGVLSALGPYKAGNVHIGYCNDFLPDPPYSAGYLAGVPWVLADVKDPTKEAADNAQLPDPNYLDTIANATLQGTAGDSVLVENQKGPALLQALAAYSVQREVHEAAGRFIDSSKAVKQVLSRATPTMPYVETVPENEAIFTVQTPKELTRLSVPEITGNRTLGDHVAYALSTRVQPLGYSIAPEASAKLFGAVSGLFEQTRDLGATKLSLDLLKQRPVGELNIALRSTLDAFSYRLDAWIAARANRRLEQMRAARPTGLYIGGYAWVEKLKRDIRPDSDGYLLAPSQAQAATAAILRSGFMANHEQGAFDIALDSKRTRRALGILEGLTRDQPLAALYGYRIERGLRDNALGKFIWPLRLTYPWRPVGAALTNEPSEAVGARDVLDGVAMLAAWEADPKEVLNKLRATLSTIPQASSTIAPDDLNELGAVMRDAVDLADSVSDLLLAEGAHQIARGNPARAAAAMAIADKQSLPIETQVGRTPRGGASYTQRVVVVCPSQAAGWPDDRRARAEPALNAWLAMMLGDPARYTFTGRAYRLSQDRTREVPDPTTVSVSLAALGLSPLSAVLLSEGVAVPQTARPGETGFRKLVASALIGEIENPATATGLDIEAGTDDHVALGLAQFEAIAMTLKTLIGKARFATRKDLVRVDEKLEAALPAMGEYTGVDRDEIVNRADAFAAEFDTVQAALLASANADELLARLAGNVDMLPETAWPAEVFAIDAAGADPAPAERDKRATAAIKALAPILKSMQEAAHSQPPEVEDGKAPTDAQIAQHAIGRLKGLFGKDFPVLPRFAIGPYATEFNASLSDQAALSVNDPWRIHGWLCQVARVRQGVDRLAAAVSAHEALCEPLASGDFKVVQFPHRAGNTWAALPEAWRKEDGVPFDPKQVPEELHAYLASLPGAQYHDINRIAPDVAIALHAPGVDAIDGDTLIAAFVCDEWPEFIPDPYQTAGIAFHYDAPGARPPQTILLALPPVLGQGAWSFDDAVDVIHEAFDLARLRGVRPRDLGGGLGAVLPGNYLPHAYTDDLPSIRVLEMLRAARQAIAKSAKEKVALPLGKI